MRFERASGRPAVRRLCARKREKVPTVCETPKLEIVLSNSLKICHVHAISVRTLRTRCSISKHVVLVDPSLNVIRDGLLPRLVPAQYVLQSK